MKNQETKYVAVRHSGFGYKGDLQFSYGLEPRPLHTKAEVQRAIRIGCFIFDDYNDCEEFVDYAMYTASGETGLIPQACKVGKYSGLHIDGLAAFIPNPGVIEAFMADPDKPMEGLA